MLKNISDNIVILIASTYFSAIIDQLDREKLLDQTDCYVAIFMHCDASTGEGAVALEPDFTLGQTGRAQQNPEKDPLYMVE